MDRAATRPPAASASDFDMDDQLGHIGSAFDDEEFDFGQHNSSSRAAKRSRTGEEELAGDGHASKRARFGQAVIARQQRLGQQIVQQPPEGAGEGVLEMKEMAAMAARGQLSQGAMEVRNKLRQLDPAEGLSILAWLVDALSRNVQHDGTPQVRFGSMFPVCSWQGLWCYGGEGSTCMFSFGATHVYGTDGNEGSPFVAGGSVAR